MEIRRLVVLQDSQVPGMSVKWINKIAHLLFIIHHWLDSSFICVYICVPKMTSRHARERTYRETSSISRTKSQSLNVYCILL